MEEIKVSVIMSVYNTEEMLLRQAIDSILTQTYENIEFLIVNDCSDQWCKDILYNYKDDRIRIIDNIENLGLAASLNKAIDVSKGKYIARMDSDDVSYMDRIEQQVLYMEHHTDVDVLAGVAAIIQNGKKTGFSGLYYKLELEVFKIQMSLANMPFVHPTVMFRTSFLNKHNLRYDESFRKAQDYNMWVRCLEYGKLDVLQKVVLDYRIHDNQLSTGSSSQREYADRTKVMCLEKLIKDYTEQEKELYIHLRDMKLYGTIKDNVKLIGKLVNENNQLKVYPTKKYQTQLYFLWWRKALWKENTQLRNNMLANSGIFFKIIEAFLAEITGFVRLKMYEKEQTKKWIREQ